MTQKKHLPGEGFDPGALEEVTVGVSAFGASPLVSPAVEEAGARELC